MGQLAALLIFSAGFGVLGFARIPKTDPPIVLPPMVVLEVPGVYDDADSYVTPDKRVQASRVNWMELPGGTPWPAQLKPVFQVKDVPVGNTRLVLVVELNKATSADRMVRLRLNLPLGVRVTECFAEPRSFTCGPPHTVKRHPDDDLRTTNVVDVAGMLPKGSTSLGFAMNFADVGQGLTAGAESAHAAVRLPYLLWGGDREQEDDDVPFNMLPVGSISVSTSYYLHEADQLSWSGTNPKVEMRQGDVWEYTVSSGSFLPPPSASGVRVSVIERNSTRSFEAGIWLGVAGGALVALAQLMIAELGRKEEFDGDTNALAVGTLS